MVLRCPECFSEREGTFDRVAIHLLRRIETQAFDDFTRRADRLGLEISDEEKVESCEWTDAFLSALERDAILPCDF